MTTTDAEAIARIISRAMLDNPTDGKFSERVEVRKERASVYADEILSYLASRREAQEPVAPSDCVDRMNCGLRRIATEPDIGLTACSRPNCPHTTQALSAPPSPAPAGEVERMRTAARALADWAEHEVGADIDLTPGLRGIRAALNGGREKGK